jgi:hypothetical protein
LPERLIYQHLLDRRRNFGIPLVDKIVLRAMPPTPSLAPAQASDDDLLWVPPAPSIASRLPPARSRGSCRGFIVDPGSNRAIVYESTLERDFACILAADRRVAHIHDQPPAVTYATRDGRRHRHTFDFRFSKVDGTSIAVAIKPSEKVDRSGIREILALIQDQARDFADRFLLRTERHITKTQAYNARFILQARRLRDDAGVAALQNIVSTLNGSARISDLVSASGLGAHGLTAIACLIDEGALQLVDAVPIDFNASVRGRVTEETRR